jgi:hypothetical protein
VLGSNSEPLDVGRRVRLITKPMRRALDVRDRGCVVCGAPPVMCDAHHLVSWIDGGETKTSNLALLCRRHHTDLHKGRWQITIVDGVVHVARPSWAEPSTTFTAARGAAPPYADSRSTAPPDAQPTSTAPPDAQRTSAASPDLQVWGEAPPDGEPPDRDDTTANRPWWRADEAALREAAAFAASG